MQETMRLNLTKQGDALRVDVAGPVDIDTSPTLRQQVLEAWTPGLKSLELDFADVDYISSPGLALLLEFRHWLAKEDAEVRLLAASAQVREVLATCRLDTLFFPDVNSGPQVPVAG